MTRSLALIFMLVLIGIAIASGNGPAMMKSLETGAARGIGYQLAHSLFGERR